MACPVTDRTGRRHICGIDFPLPEIYTCMTQSPASSGYATLFDPEGGDRLPSRQPQTGPSGERLDGTGGIPEGRGHRTERHRSRDLGLIPTFRRGAHLLPHSSLGGRRWVAGIGIPRLVIEQEIDDFRFLHGFRRRDLGAVLRRAARPGTTPLAPRIRSAPPFGTGVGTAPACNSCWSMYRPPLPVSTRSNSLYALIRCNPDQAPGSSR